MTVAIDHDRRRLLSLAVTSVAVAGFGSAGCAMAQSPASSRLPVVGELPSFGGATTWLSSPPLTAAGLRGKVVLVNFWTYTCINSLRALPYVRAWASKYKDKGLVVIGVQAPEFSFEKNIDNIRWAIHAMRIDYAEVGRADGPVVILLHGWPYDIHSFVEVAPLLATSGYRVIVPNLRGYGSTRFLSSETLRNGQQSAVALDMIGLMDALNIQKAIIAGFDWGARAADIIAALWPERCKALVSVSGYLIGSPATATTPLPPKAEFQWWYQFYFATELQLDLQLQITRDTVKAQTDSVKLTNHRLEHGVATKLDVLQAQQVLDTANAQIPDLERQIAQEENSISILIGDYPEAVQRGLPLVEQSFPPEVSPGLPSALLERRPDIREAEQVLVATNADIGVAKAEFFPQIALTGSGGGAFGRSSAFSSLMGTHLGIWSYGAQVSQPIFTGGALRGNLHLAESENKQALIGYRQTIQRAFGDVSDALVGYQKNHEVRMRQQATVADLQETVRISKVRYQGGTTTYLEVLDGQRSLYLAELTLAEARGDEYRSLIQLYKSLGGGWQLEAQTPGVQAMSVRAGNGSNLH